MSSIAVGLLVQRTREYLEGLAHEPVVDVEGPLAILFERFALSGTERAIIAVLLAHELCPRSRAILRDLNTELVADPTVDVLRRVVFGDLFVARAWDELADTGRLRRCGFVSRTDGGDVVPEHRQTLALGRRVLALAFGLLDLDPAITAFATRFTPPPRETLLAGGNAIARLETAIDRHEDLVILRGRAGSGRRSLAASIAASRGRNVLVIEGHMLDRNRDALEQQLRVISREARLLDLVPLVRDVDALEDHLDLVEQELPQFALATASREVARRWRRAPTVIELPPVDRSTLASLWRRALPAAGSGDAEYLASMYPLSPALVEAVGRVAVTACGGSEMRPVHVEAGIRSVLDDRLAGLATRVAITQTWDDLVLPEDQAAAVVELLARIRRRRKVYEDWGFAEKVGKGLGVSALFSGPPGTGKTMCAGLIARELGTELYQVDISRISSKWVGESEKNLANLFDAAEAGHAILLFDEADALFGKRTDVKTSTDRHANQETNFLLQRLETFAGICILTTNHENGIDEAFRRRLSVHVRLPVPDLDERRRLWTALIPRSAPRGSDLDLDGLADKYAMTGGYIRNAVLRAAFLAADEETPITGVHLRRAAQLEYEAMGKLVTS